MTPIKSFLQIIQPKFNPHSGQDANVGLNRASHAGQATVSASGLKAISMIATS